MKALRVRALLSASLFLLFPVLGCFGSSSVDETLTNGARGSAVVEAVCSRIEASCLFGEDHSFLRRIAFVESNDGNDEETYRDGYYGGIWQVDYNTFQQIQNSSLVESEKLNINSVFGIQWNSLLWSDLLKPLHSGLAARLFVRLKSLSTSESFSTAIEQAKFWSNHYRPGGDRGVFVNKSVFLRDEGSRGAADVIFVVDESDRVALEDFEKVKRLLVEVVDSLDVGADPTHDVRVSVASFSNHVTRVFDFETHTRKDKYKAAIGNMTYLGGGTNTHLALTFLRETAFDPSSGARPGGIPKMAVLLTYGISDHYEWTLEEAKKLREEEDEVTILVVGLGGITNHAELALIATQPVCEHLLRLDSFGVFEDGALVDLIVRKIREAPVHVKRETTLELHEESWSRRCRMFVPRAGMTVEMYTTPGYSTIYFSDFSTPNPSFHDVKFLSGSNHAAIFFSGTSRYLYCLVVGGPERSVNVTLETCPGNCNPCSMKPCPDGKVCTNTRNFTHTCIDPEPVAKITGASLATRIQTRIYTPPPTTGTYRRRYTPTMDKTTTPKRYTPTMDIRMVPKRYTPTMDKKTTPKRYTPTMDIRTVPKRYTPTIYTRTTQKRYTPSLAALRTPWKTDASSSMPTSRLTPTRPSTPAPRQTPLEQPAPRSTPIPTARRTPQLVA